MEQSDTERYDPGTVRAKWQAVWAEQRAFEVENDPPPSGAPKSYVLEQLPYPSGAPHGAHAGLHDRRRRHASVTDGMHVLHPQGFDSFGLPAENAAIKAGDQPREIVERNITHICGRWREPAGVRLAAQAVDARAGVHPVAAMAVPALLRARPRLPEGRSRQVVPERPDGARERAGARRSLRAVRRRGRVAFDGAVVLPDHRLRAGAARRPRDRRLAGSIKARSGTGSDAPTVPRSCSRSRSSARTSPSSRRVPTRSSARRSSCWRRSTSSSRAPTRTRCGTTYGAPGRGEDGGACGGRGKTGVFTGLHALTPSTASGCRSTSPTTS